MTDGHRLPTETGRAFADFKDKAPNWCPGCGDFGVLGAMQRAAAELDLDPDRTVLVTGIGCSGNVTAFFRTYGFHGVHGRALPAATGIKLADPALTVLVAGGDGDGFGIGLGHLVHAARRNLDVTYIVMDNQTYGLTKGQVSPTSAQGFVTKTTPDGSPDAPVDALALSLIAGATYLGVGFSGDIKRLTELIKGAVRHEGFSLVQTMSPCVTFNKTNTFSWYKDRLVDLEAEGHDPTDRAAALHQVTRTDGRIPHGLIFRTERPPLHRAVGVLGGREAAPATEDLEFTLRSRAADLKALRDRFA
ncbi:MAG: 2-oxoacid:ferredoxin oxidoreductase subunit beta [Euryarchaeota archaeon]|nr:2-oxoacid:ferredoxin oxidoreductase subunit beta [Euryarchaeota archaeon]